MAKRKSTPAPAHELPALPTPATVLARAAASALRRPRGLPELPRDSVQVRRVSPEPARLAAYRKVCGIPAGDTVPLTWPHVLGGSLQLWLLGRPEFPLPMLGLVHLANRFEQSRPIAVDQAVDVTVRLDASRETDHGLEFDMITTATAGRVHLWEGVSTYLYRSSSKTAKSGDKAAPPAPPRLDRQQALAVPANIGRRYARVSGDYNPIHLSAPTAKLFGFPRAIAHGMWTAARCLSLLESAHDMTPEIMQIRFRKPLLLPAKTELRSRKTDDGLEFLLVGKGDRLHLDGTLG